MQCTDARIQLDQAMQAGAQALTGELREHLAGCVGCRDYAEDIRLDRLLETLPVPPLSTGFAERALDKAWAAKVGREVPQRSSAGWWLAATAASLVLAVGLVFKAPWWGTEPTVSGLPVQVVQVAPQSVRQVELLMVSAEALPDAYITVQLDEHVGLAGYSGINNIRWQAPISAGNNQLSLPVQLLGDHGGVIVVEVESGGARKRMTFNVEPAVGNEPALKSV